MARTEASLDIIRALTVSIRGLPKDGRHGYPRHTWICSLEADWQTHNLGLTSAWRLTGSAVYCGTWIFTPRRRIHCLPWKNAELPIFATFIYNSRFFGLLSNFTIYKTMKSSGCKAVSYGSVLSLLRQSLTQDDLCAHCAVFLNNSNIF